jgi:FkbM family methyltransferase
MASSASRRQVAAAFEHQLRLHASHIDLANRGRYRSTHLLDEFFFELVEIAVPALFVEAGAFDATASRRIARDLPATRVVAFEANPSNYQLWTREVDFVGAGVEYLDLALAEAPGTRTFHLRSTESADPEALVEDNSLLPRASSSPNLSAETVTVQATTLDQHFPGRTARAALWVDVEGANREVLSGGHEFLRTCDVVKIEVEDVPLWDNQWLAVDVFEAMLAAGLNPIARDVQADGQYNALFVSETLGAGARAVVAHERFLRTQIGRELPGIVGAIRRNGTVRRAARGIRSAVTRSRG